MRGGAELCGTNLAESRPGYAGAYAYDDGDKLLSVSSGGVALKTYGYDAAGRTTSVASSAGTTALAYDYEGRAVSISGPGVSQTNAYNGLDARVGSTAGGVSRAYLRDGASPTDPLLKDGAATYTPGESVRSGGATSFLSAGLKSVDAQSSPSQTLSATRVYDAFGNAVSSSGSWSGALGYGGVYGYQEDATGLRLLGRRLYDPSTGRFLTRDPIEDGRNWYAYVGNDPVNGADPEGFGRVKIWKVIREGLEEVIYHIYPSRPDAKRAAKRAEGTPKVPIKDPGHNGGPPHFHPDPKPKPNVHYASQADAEAARDRGASGWEGFRGFVPFLNDLINPASDISDVSEGVADAIDPAVQDARRGFNGFARQRWLDGEDGALLG